MPIHRLLCIGVGLLFGVGSITMSGQTRSLERVCLIPGPATTVHAHGTRLYVSDGPTLKILDIADPAVPAQLGTYTFPQDIYSTAVQGTVAYAAVDFHGLGIVDVSDPLSPTLLATVEIPGQALSVAVSGSTVVVANRLSGLEVVDVTDPASPVARGEFFTEGYAIEVAAEGTHAYVADAPEGMAIVDLSGSGEPRADSVGTASEPPAAVDVGVLPEAGITVAAVVSARSLVELFDVSDPSAPIGLGTHRLRGQTPTFDIPSGLSKVVYVKLCNFRFMAEGVIG